jgi:hypothetical protein
LRDKKGWLAVLDLATRPGRQKKTGYQAAASKFSMLRQLFNLIPTHSVPKLASNTGVEDHARKFSLWSQVVSLLDAQLSHAQGR